MADVGPVAEQGSVTLWLLGLAVMILFVAGMAVDLWQATAHRRALAGLADAAAVAGAGVIDEDAFRRDATARLDPAGAEARAREMLAERVAATDLPVTDAAVAADADHVEVVVRGEVDVTLLRVLRPDAGPWAVTVRAVVEPRMTRGP